MSRATENVAKKLSKQIKRADGVHTLSLTGSASCARCEKDLTDPLSFGSGHGPDCARHTLAKFLK